MEGKTLAIKIFNIVIIALCITSMLGYFLTPLWRIKTKLTFTDELVEYVAEQVEKESKSDGGEGGESDMDPAEMTRTILSGVSLSLAVELRSGDVLKILFTKDAAIIEDAIEHNVDLILEMLSDNIDAVTKKAISNVMQEAVMNFAASLAAEGTDDDTIREKLEEAGFNDEYINSKVDELYDLLSTGTATVDEILAIIAGILDDFGEILATMFGYEGDLAEMKAEVLAQAREILESLADEDGYVTVGNALNDILASVLSGEGLPEEYSDRVSEARPDMPVFKTTLSTSRGGVYMATAESTGETTAATEQATEGEPENTDAEELKLKIKNAIMEKIDEDAVNTIMNVVSGIAVVMLISIAAWAYLLIKLIVKFFMPNPGTKLKVPIIFGTLPFLFFWLVPTIIVALIPSILTKLGAFDAVPFDVSQVLRLSFSSSGTIAELCAIGLIILSFFYMPIRRTVEKESYAAAASAGKPVASGAQPTVTEAKPTAAEEQPTDTEEK